MFKKLCDGKMNNRGSALLTVILVVGFLTILATTLLYVTGMNFQIKQMDYRNKKNFYTGETGLEKVRAELMSDVSEAAVDAYSDVTMRFIEYENASIRELEYNKAFVENIQQEWSDKMVTQGEDNWLMLFKGYCGVGDDGPYYLSMDATVSAAVLDPHAAEGFVRIKGLKVKYTDPETHLTTLLSTDLDVYAPAVDWSAVETIQSLDADTTEEMAWRKSTVDVSGCVRYANWKKE